MSSERASKYQIECLGTVMYNLVKLACDSLDGACIVHIKLIQCTIYTRILVIRLFISQNNIINNKLSEIFLASPKDIPHHN